MKDGKILGENITGINQILPHMHKWAWDLYIKSLANTWVPTDISMQKDIEQWRSRNILSEDERLLIRRSLGFFAGAESLVGNNLLLSIFRYVTDPECRQYILRQAFEESLHNLTVVYICDSLDLSITEVYEAYQNIPAIKRKDDFLMQVTSDKLSYSNYKQRLLRNLITYYIICEGIFFYSGFAMLLSFGRQNKLPGISEQIQYTIRDESLHIQFGVNLISKIIEQEPELWSAQFIADTINHIEIATDIEITYAHDVLPRGVLGLNAQMFVDYMQYIAERRLQMLGLPSIFKAKSSPFPWLSETVDLPKNKNFFETRVTDYQVGTLIDDFE